MIGDDVAALLVRPAEEIAAGVGALAGGLDDDTAHYARQARSLATWRAYGVAWRAWAAWCSAEGRGALPATPGDVARYLAGRARGGARWSSLAHTLQVLGLAHRLLGADPPGTAPLVRAVVAGIKREHGTAPARPAPELRLKDLRNLVEVLDAGGEDPEPQRIRDRAILLVAWFGALRRSEVAAIARRDLELRDEGIAVRIPRSKADPEGAGELIGLPKGRRPGLCPVRALTAWIELLDAGADPSVIPSGAVFRRVDRWGNIGAPLGDRAIAIVVERIARRAGYPAGSFSGHSFRSGFASEAAAQGVSEREIARQTRHKSMTVLRRYIHSGGLFVDHPALRLV